MEEFKLNFKWPTWLIISLVIGYSIWGIATIIYIIDFFININEIITLSITYLLIDIFGIIGFIFFNVFGWIVIIGSYFKENYYFIINKEGIYNNQVNLIKKYLSWENELYYCITNSYIGLYKSKMLLLESEIKNENNIIDGYISIKTKKALKKYYDNKYWIVLSTKLLKNNKKIDDLINMINKSRGIEV